ncbi:hypothetical protein [Paenibacillus massiliensis]|uniref:hypothetical protein n=1 Tax=Paenibacillus massiliensis TaxID=225917 RepID=UPI0004705061|nr:hypothetical protein [Paenibacillus massiliensis]
MIYIFRTVRPSLVIFLAGIIIGYGYLRMMDVGDFIMMYQTIFGGKPLNGIMLKGLFIMTISLLQYVNIGYTAFYIDNFESLSVRYGSRDIWLRALLKGSLMITVGFVLSIYFVWAILDAMLNSFEIIQTISLGTLGIMARIYLFCIIIVLIQICLLMKITKISTYLIMGGITVMLALTSQFEGVLFNILPQISRSPTTLFNIAGNLVFALFLIVIIWKINKSKELIPNED